MEKTLHLILEKLDNLEKGQRNLETGQRSLEEGQRNLEAGQKRIEETLHRIEVSQQEDVMGMLKLISQKLNTTSRV